MRPEHRIWVILSITVMAVAATFWFPPIAQDPAYHEFADRHTFFGIPNFGNVASNLPFMLVGVFGLLKTSSVADPSIRIAYVVLCIGVTLVGFGSAFYHYAPSTPALFWDRLPMTIAFMALLSIVVSDRISERIGRLMLWPLIIIGVASVAYWNWSEGQGQGDLRAYGLVQFLSMLLIALMLLTCSARNLSSRWLWGSLGTYAVAKVAEYFDAAIYNATGVMSGHSIKHVLGAISVLMIVFAVVGQRR